MTDTMPDHRPRVVVVGDLMLDGWWNGHAGRLAREAPAPVVELDGRRSSPGGAGNAAANLAALGAETTVVGVLGDDAAGDTMLELLRREGVDVSAVVRSRAVRTTVKNRVVSDDTVLLRIDEIDHAALPNADVDAMAAALRRAAAEADAVLVADYGSATMLRLSRSPLAVPLLVVDAHDPARWREWRPDVVTPNAAEFGSVVSAAVPDHGDRAGFVAAHAAGFLAAAGAAAAAVTLDRDGAVYLDRDGCRVRTHAHPTAERRASGAGDTFAAALTLALAAGWSETAAMELAQAAADVVVRKPETSVCTAAEVDELLGRSPTPIVPAPELSAAMARHRAAGERVVFTNGCFDVLHRGHTSYLRQAKRHGDVLVVALNDDDSVRRLKGPDRPINAAVDRAGVIAALECVDYVTVFADDTPKALIEALRPDVYVKGGDYTPQMLPETAIVESVGGEVVIVDYVADHSTTALVDRIRGAAAGGSS